MKIEILGTGGGLGSGEPTTAIRIDGGTLLDAGSGLEKLPLEEIRRIRRVFLTHAHVDHVCMLPQLAETLFESSESPPVDVYALPEVLSLLQEHMFNGQLWPDFGRIPDAEHPSLVWHPLEAGETRPVGDGLMVQSFSTWHGVPSCGYKVTDASGKTFVFTGDTQCDDRLLACLNGLGPVDVLMTECSLPDRLASTANRFYHMTPSLLTDLVERMDCAPGEIWLGHFKPGHREEILENLQGSRYRVPAAGTIEVLSD